MPHRTRRPLLESRWPTPRSATGRVSPTTLGIAFVVLSVVVGVLLFQKPKISAWLRPGETLTMQFTQAHGLREYVSKVKVAGVPVGVVTSMEPAAHGRTTIAAKVDEEVLDKVGTAPSASVRPTTLLGGNYYIDLDPGGGPGRSTGTIPASRTRGPVELDEVLATLQPDVRSAVRGTVKNFDRALRNGAVRAVRDLVRIAPPALRQGQDVLQGLRGTRPEVDLPLLVTDSQQAARVMTRRPGQLGGIVTGLRDTAAVLERRRHDIAATMRRLPQTLATTRAGLERLDATLVQLGRTAGPARPIAQNLDRLLARATPVLAEARPVVRRARQVLTQTRPLVRDLSPTVQRLQANLDNVRGDVLDRVNGPILDTVNSPYHGAGRYAGTGSYRRFYQELGYLTATADRATMVDENGAMINFLAGSGPGSVAGLPLSLEEMFRRLANGQGAAR